MTLMRPQTVTRCTTKMAKAHIDGTVDVETIPSTMEIRFGERQISLGYGGEVTTIRLKENGDVDDSQTNIAPGHDEGIMNLLMGAYENHWEIQELEQGYEEY